MTYIYSESGQLIWDATLNEWKSANEWDPYNGDFDFAAEQLNGIIYNTSNDSPTKSRTPSPPPRVPIGYMPNGSSPIRQNSSGYIKSPSYVCIPNRIRPAPWVLMLPTHMKK
jgi:hypothetical protein